MIEAGLTRDPITGAPYFAEMDTFISYTWRGPAASLSALVLSVEDALSKDGIEVRRPN